MGNRFLIVPVLMAGLVASCGAEAGTMIGRSEFGMTTGLPDAVSDEVKIIIPVEAMRE
jgi:polyisoprenoid-binding protein YceI